ncbi:MAG TPA: DUF3108 domain-containing protein, partial [Mucilaginibacter sp.]
MKKIFSCCLMFMALHLAGFSQELTKISEPVFKVGEKLSYKMQYGFFTAAEANIRVEASDKKLPAPAFRLIAEGKTAGTFDVFYKVRNRYESYVDQNTLEPYFYTENRREGSWKHSDNVTFDQKDNKVTATKGEFTFKGKTFDFVSAYYFARTIDVSKLK